MKVMISGGVSTLAALVLASAAPASAMTTVITFDNIPEGTITSTQYSGVVITGASVLTQNSHLNAPYPPVSDPNVVYDYLDGTITLDFTTNVSEVGAFVTGAYAITENVYSGTTLLQSTATTGANYLGAGTGYSPNIFLNISPGANITSAVFTNNKGVGNTFTLDNVTIVGGSIITNGVPEPATWALMLVGVGVAGASMRASRRPPAARA